MTFSDAVSEAKIGQVGDLLNVPRAVQVHYGFNAGAKRIFVCVENEESRRCSLEVSALSVVKPATTILSSHLRSVEEQDGIVLDKTQKTILTPLTYVQDDLEQPKRRPSERYVFCTSSSIDSYEETRETAAQVFGALGIVDTGGHLLSPIYRILWGNLLRIGGGVPSEWIERGRQSLPQKKDYERNTRAGGTHSVSSRATPARAFTATAKGNSNGNNQGHNKNGLRGYCGYVYGESASLYAEILKLPEAEVAQLAVRPLASGGALYQYGVFTDTEASVLTSLVPCGSVRPAKVFSLRVDYPRNKMLSCEAKPSGEVVFSSAPYDFGGGLGTKNAYSVQNKDSLHKQLLMAHAQLLGHHRPYVYSDRPT